MFGWSIPDQIKTFPKTLGSKFKSEFSIWSQTVHFKHFHVQIILPMKSNLNKSAL